MNAEIPPPVHESYTRHRRQRAYQIVLPVILAVLLCLAAGVLVSLATFQGQGDAGRWAAISTIWIVIPVFFMGLVFLILLSGMAYLLIRLLGIAPVYTGKAQDFVQKLGSRIRKAADQLVRPIIYLDGVGASLKTFFGRK